MIKFQPHQALMKMTFRLKNKKFNIAHLNAYFDPRESIKKSLKPNYRKSLQVRNHVKKS